MGRAQQAVSAGDTVYFKGGTYTFDRGTSTCSSGTAIISGVVLDKSGSPGATINYFAVPGETPVFDYDAVRDSCRIRGITLSGNYIHIKGLELQRVRQNNNLNHENWGIWISGSNNILEQLNTHDIMGAGVFINGGSDNLVLNCDSHDNLDEFTSNGAGESADGFGCHGSGSGNVFRGCRAWWNADDGYDFINSNGACTVEDSWAWYNGYVPGTLEGIGNGNGFKAGGYGLDPAKFPNNVPTHVVRNCLAVANKAAGFYANHHPGSPLFYNNTAYGNHPNYNMLGITNSGGDVTVGEYRNNIALSGTDFSNRNNADEDNNSWTLGDVSVSDADFQNVNIEGLDAPRQADGSLPMIPNFRLAEDSDLIDKGVDLGFPYAGDAPDLGCFEVGLEPPVVDGEGGAGGMNEDNAGAGAGDGGAMAGGSGGMNTDGGMPIDSETGGASGNAATGGGANPGPATPNDGAGTGGTTIAMAGNGGTVGAPMSEDVDAGADGCSCSLPGKTDRPGSALTLLLVSLGLAMLARMRRGTTRRLGALARRGDTTQSVVNSFSTGAVGGRWL